MNLDKKYIASILVDAEWVGAPFEGELPQGVVDSRLVTPGVFFAALPGKVTDGHQFLADACMKGAVLLVVSRTHVEQIRDILRQYPRVAALVVSDVLRALVTLARAWRAQCAIPVIGITGSVGKTSTKELISTMLRFADIPHIASYGNQNTLLGAALTMLRVRAWHKVAVFEMGISKRGEMHKIAEMVRPTIGVITYIGHSHMEGIGGLEDIAAEKRSLFSFLNSDEIGIILGDQPLLSNVSYAHPVVRFGTKMINQVQARKVKEAGDRITFILKIYGDRYPLVLSINNKVHVYHALAAAAVGEVLKIPRACIISAIQKPIEVRGRNQEIPLREVQGTLIHDAYNAIPESMKAALLAFEQRTNASKKIAVLGDMLELGVTGTFWHRQLGRMVRKVPSLDHVILVGTHVQATTHTLPRGLSYEIVPTWQEAVGCVRNELVDGAVVLVKGSRGVALDRLVAALVGE